MSDGPSDCAAQEAQERLERERAEHARLLRCDSYHRQARQIVRARLLARAGALARLRSLEDLARSALELGLDLEEREELRRAVVEMQRDLRGAAPAAGGG